MCINNWCCPWGSSSSRDPRRDVLKPSCMDEENCFNLADYADLMDEDYVSEEACTYDFYLEYVPEGESWSSSAKPVGTEATETPPPPTSNFNGEYFPKPVSTGEAPDNHSGTMASTDNIANGVHDKIMADPSVEHLLWNLEYYSSSNEDKTFSPSICLEFHECAAISASETPEQQA